MFHAPCEGFLPQWLSWRQILTALEIAIPKGESLPATVTCPFCMGKFAVYPDIRAGVWCYCWVCGWSGWLIELAMDYWKLDIHATLQKLDFYGVCLPLKARDPVWVNTFLTRGIGYRKHLLESRKKAASFSFQDSAVLRRLHDQFGLRSGDNPGRWVAQMGQFIGGMTVQDATDAFWPFDGELRGFLPSTHGWQDVITIPHCDLPGRVCGYWIVGREGRWPEDWVYNLASRIQLRNYIVTPEDRETGLGFHEALLNYSPHFGETAFIVQDPAVALTLHGQHFRDHGDVLPVAVAYEGVQGQVRHTWKCMPKKDLVFWAQKPCREVFAQARVADGTVVFGSFDTTEDGRTHLVWLRKMEQQAVPWRLGLANALAALPDPEAETILLHLGHLESGEWQTILDVAAPASRSRLNALRKRKWAYQVIPHGRQDISERPDGYYVEDSGEKISEVTIRVNYVVRKPHRQRTDVFYFGTFKYKGERYPFKGNLLGLRDRLATLIEHTLAAKGVGVVSFDTAWRGRLLDLAIRFHPPKLVTRTADVKHRERKRKRNPIPEKVRKKLR